MHKGLEIKQRIIAILYPQDNSLPDLTVNEFVVSGKVTLHLLKEVRQTKLINTPS